MPSTPLPPFRFSPSSSNEEILVQVVQRIAALGEECHSNKDLKRAMNRFNAELTQALAEIGKSTDLIPAIMEEAAQFLAEFANQEPDLDEPEQTLGDWNPAWVALYPDQIR